MLRNSTPLSLPPLRRARCALPQALTATATAAVRADVVKQLGMREPPMMVQLIGDFDRPNIFYEASRYSLSRYVCEL